jgi:murein L,D-transpeptidase YafK
VTFRSSWRTLTASAAIAAAVALGGCQNDGMVGIPAKALKPLTTELVSLLETKNMEAGSPMLARIFKEESEVEIWKQDRQGNFALLKTYPICRWSGELGPKIKEGDRQAPEGFYTITPAQMNPHSQFHLAVNIGYPNEFDRSLGRTGAHLMIHGDCSSSGCYAMTDDQIVEIYSLAREAFFGGQRAFQIQAYPFRMTAINMARHRNNPNMPFWKMLKRGNDHFEVTRQQPKVNVCEKRYVFDVDAPEGTKFNPAARCPAYSVPASIASAVNDKTRHDEVQIATLIRRGTPAAPIKTGRDGGSNPAFMSQVKSDDARFADGSVRVITNAHAPNNFTPKSTPSYEAPPPVTASVADVPMPRPSPRRATTGGSTGGMSLASGSSRPAPPPPPAQSSPPENPPASNLFGGLFSSNDKPQPAPPPQAQPAQSDNVLGRVGRWIGVTEEPKRAPRQKAATRKPPKAQPASRNNAPATAAAIRPKPAAAKPEPKKPEPKRPQTAEVEPQVRSLAATGSTGTTGSTSAPQPRPPIRGSTLSGATPVVPSESFDTRFNATR